MTKTAPQGAVFVCLKINNLEVQEKTSFIKKWGMSWAQRLKRVFNIDIEVCDVCGKKMKIITCIEAPAVINRILAHCQSREAGANDECQRPEQHGPPVCGLFD